MQCEQKAIPSHPIQEVGRLQAQDTQSTPSTQGTPEQSRTPVYEKKSTADANVQKRRNKKKTEREKEGKKNVIGILRLPIPLGASGPALN